MSQTNPRNPYETHRTDIEREVYYTLIPSSSGGETKSLPTPPPTLEYVDELVMSEILEYITREIQRPGSPLGQSIINLAKEAQNATPST